MPDSYNPAGYWSERLEAEFNLRGTGHMSYSAEYNDWMYRLKRRRLRQALRGVPRSGRALDIGSGTGWVVEQLVRRGMQVVGCDITDVAVEGLRRRFPELEFHRCEVGADPLPGEPASYDLVSIFDVSYHLTDDAKWRTMVADVARAVRPGGRVVVSDGLGEDDVDAAKHVRFRSRRTWSEAAASHGLELVRVKPYYRWMSRDRYGKRLSGYSDEARGRIEFALEFLAPIEPHLRTGVFAKAR